MVGCLGGRRAVSDASSMWQSHHRDGGEIATFNVSNLPLERIPLVWPRRVDQSLGLPELSVRKAMPDDVSRAESRGGPDGSGMTARNAVSWRPVFRPRVRFAP